MALPIDEYILNALRGLTTASEKDNTRLPKPLLIKIYIACLKKGRTFVMVIFLTVWFWSVYSLYKYFLINLYEYLLISRMNLISIY